MNADEILSNAHAVRPDLIDRAAASLQFLEKIGSPYAEDLREEFSLILNFTVEKVAAAGTADKALKTIGIGAAMTLGGMLATSAATDLYDAAKRTLTRGMNFRRTLAANPNLAKTYEMKDLKPIFNTMHRFAPEFTADPLVSGALLSQMATMRENDYIDWRPIKEMIDSRKNLQEAKHKQFSTNAFAKIEDPWTSFEKDRLGIRKSKLEIQAAMGKRRGPKKG